MKTAIVAASLLIVAAAAAQQPPGGIAAGEQPGTAIIDAGGAPMAGGARTSKLIGSKVYNGDIAIGQIEDVLVDLDHATVTAVILSVGGFLGIGDKLVAVPVSRIRIGSEAKFTADLTGQQLAGAPAFDFAKLK